MTKQDDGIYFNDMQWEAWDNGKLLGSFDSRSDAHRALPLIPTKNPDNLPCVNRADGIRQREVGGYWHVYAHGQYVCNYRSRANAQRRFNHIMGLPPETDVTPDPPPSLSNPWAKPDTGVWQDKGRRWHAYLNKRYLGSYLFEHQAKAKIERMSKP